MFPTLGFRGAARKSGGSSVKTSELYSSGFDAGWELDVFRGIKQSVKASENDLEEGVAAALDQLAVLVGKPPGALNETLSESRPLPDVSLDFAVGVPADIIRQRPDIRKAEQEKQLLLASAADDAQAAYELARDQYATGMTNFNELLEAQRSLLSIEDQLVQSKGSVLAEGIQSPKPDVGH